VKNTLSLRLAFLVCALAALSGCGFSLRGTAVLPPELQTMQIQSNDANSDIVRELRRVLRNNDVEVDSAEQSSGYRLQVGQEQTSERALSVNSLARAGEYQLTMSVPFQLLNSGTAVLGPETISIERVYLADPENAAAKSDEARLIQQEMRRELALQILRRLQAAQL
jgi:LPS-assembly lipoprotein